MLFAPTPKIDEARLEVVREHVCAYVPHEERFDAITRTVCEMLEVPIALVSIVEQNEQWFRSTQGLGADRTPRNVSFCGHAVASMQVLCINDTLEEPDFCDNPFVTGPPHIRAYLGYPLEMMPGLVVGTLCAIDTRPRNFTEDDIAAMKALASMVEVELRLVAVSDVQSALLSELSDSQRQAVIDPLTGCWNLHGLELLLQRFAQMDSQTVQGTGFAQPFRALCHIRVAYAPVFPSASAALLQPLQDIAAHLLAQQLRQRLALHSALACGGPQDFYALLRADSEFELIDAIQALQEAPAGVTLRHTVLGLQPGLDGREILAVLQSLQTKGAIPCE